MKKTIILVLVCSTLLTLASCNGTNASPVSNNELVSSPEPSNEPKSSSNEILIQSQQEADDTNDDMPITIDLDCDVGDIIKFGKYEWRVLDIQNKEILIISDLILEYKAYNDEHCDITWEACSLRKYLNGQFIEDTFNRNEKKLVLEVNLVNDHNQWYGTIGGADTHDKVFCLSIEEVVRYFGDSGQLESRPKSEAHYISDQFNAARYTEDEDGFCSVGWWLRSPGEKSFYASVVYREGTIRLSGEYTSGTFVGVRPALWLHLG